MPKVVCALYHVSSHSENMSVVVPRVFLLFFCIVSSAFRLNTDARERNSKAAHGVCSYYMGIMGGGGRLARA